MPLEIKTVRLPTFHYCTGNKLFLWKVIHNTPLSRNSKELIEQKREEAEIDYFFVCMDTLQMDSLRRDTRSPTIFEIEDEDLTYHMLDSIKEE